MIKKQWKKIRGYNYMISNYGEVSSLYSKRHLKPFVQPNGKSLYISLWKNGEVRVFGLAKLVVKYFKDNWTLKKQYAIHLDHNRYNNIETNLECSTRADMLRYWYRFRNQVRGIYKFSHGKKNYRAAIKYKDKVVTVGYYKKRDDAVTAYYSAYIGLYDQEPFILTTA